MSAQVGPGSENIVPHWLSTRISRSRMKSAAMSPCWRTGTSALSNAGAVASDFGLRDLRRDYPGVESITRTILAAGYAHPPTLQRDDLDVELLAGREVHISVLVEIPAEALRGDVIMPGQNIAIECAAICDRSNIAAVHVDQSKIEALGGFPGTIEPHPSLPRGDRRCSSWGRCW